MTYGDLFELLLRSRPELKNSIVDYRPAKGAYAIQIWLNDGTHEIVKYNPDTESFE